MFLLNEKNFRFVKYITVEPTICLYFVALATSNMCDLNLLLQKACHPHHRPDSADTCVNEVSAQKEVTVVNTWSKLGLFALPVVFVVFAGAWSDNAGKRRRPLIILPIVGQILADLLYIVNVYFWSWPPIVASLTGSLVPGMTGARSCLNLGASSYLADITTKDDRTYRLGLLVALFFVSSPIGAVLGGYLYLKFGFYGVWATTVCMNVAAIVFTLVFVKNTHVDEPKTGAAKFFDPEQALQSLAAITRKREGFKRSVTLLVVATAAFSVAPLNGEYSVLYLFVRYMFHWDLQTYGLYAAYKMVIILIGTVIALGLLSRVLRLSDATIGIIAAVTQILSNVGNAFVTHPYEMYIYPIVDFMHGSSMAVSFSIASKTVDPSEVGRVNGAISAFKALVPLVVVPTYNFVYNRSLDIFPGSFFLLSASIGAALLVIFSVLYILQNIDQSREPIVEECTKL